MLFHNKLRALKICTLACLALLGQVSTGVALSVNPLVVEISANSPNNKTTLRVHNDGASPMPIEIVASKLTLAEDGTQTNTPAKGKFLVFPPQAKIPPGGSQSFRVQWLGDPSLKASETYTLSVNQLPVELTATKSDNVQMLFQIGAIINVAPSDSKPALSVVKTEIERVPSIGNSPVVTFENTGNRYALVSDGSVVLSSGGWRKVLPREEVTKLLGMGLVQPGARRRLKLAVSLPPEITRYDVRVDFTQR